MHNKKENNKPISKTTKPPNRRERRKRVEAKPPVVDDAIQKHSLTLIVKKGFGSLLFWLIFSITVGSFLFIAYPRVLLYPGKTLNPGQPFQIPFILRNDGYWPIRDIDYSLSLENIEFGQGNTLPHAYSGINETRIPRLAPGKSSTISLGAFIDLLKQSFGIVLPPKAVTSAEISIDLSYRSYLIPYTFRNRIRFKTDINGASEYVWSEYHGQK